MSASLICRGGPVRRAVGRVLVALAAILAAITIGLVSLFAVPAASATTLLQAQNGVGVIGVAGGQVVGLHEQKLPGESRERAPGYDQIVVGSGVGAEGGAAAVEPPAFPNFEDPSQPPGPGWEWRGSGSPGSSQGSWYNPSTDESLHPDLGHGGSIGPHYDYRAPDGVDYRVYPDGRVVPK